jgi:hypothetical protein
VKNSLRASRIDPRAAQKALPEVAIGMPDNP